MLFSKMKLGCIHREVEEKPMFKAIGNSTFRSWHWTIWTTVTPIALNMIA